MTNLEIMMLIQIHCFVYQDQITVMNGSPAAEAGIKTLLGVDLIEPRCPPPSEREYCGYRSTDRGAAHLNNLGNTELPMKVWV